VVDLGGKFGELRGFGGIIDDLKGIEYDIYVVLKISRAFKIFLSGVL
jgi:hypothetical protein